MNIVYFTGGNGIVWTPADKGLGGSEQAVVHLSENWVKMNNIVTVYGNFEKDINLNGVSYLVWNKFIEEQNLDKPNSVLIVWRTPGIYMMMDYMKLNPRFKPNKMIVDFHDNFSYTLVHLDQPTLLDYFKKVDQFNVKSNYHKNCLLEYTNIDPGKINVILNGVRIEEFKNNNNYIRNPYRFCYCSSYDRGLQTILEKIWPHIYAMEPKAELHIYYGMDHIYDDNFKTRLKLLMGQPGVMDHGRQPVDMVVREKYMSSFHLYMNNSVAEIDCISIRESLVTGCIPVISSFGVFKERNGLQFNWEPSNDTLCKMIAMDLVAKMNDNNFMISAREQLIKSETIIGWDTVAKDWLKKM